MNSAYAGVIVAFAAVIALFALMIVRERRTSSKARMKRITDSWGKSSPRLFSHEEMLRIRAYSDSIGRDASDNAIDGDAEKNSVDGNNATKDAKSAYRITAGGRAIGEIDDITANDVALDEVFGTIPQPFSSPGQEVLYAWLRNPEISGEPLAERNRLADLFSENETIREKLCAIFDETGYLKSESFFGAIRGLDGAESIGRMKYIVLGLLTLLAVIGLFFVPLAAVIALIPLLLIDFRVHMDMKRKAGSQLGGFRAILRLLDASDAVIRENIPELAPYSAELAGLRDGFERFRRGSFFVTSGGSTGTGIGSAVLEYVNMFFHTDLIQFDRMLEAVHDHGREAVRIFEILGTLDACISIASYRTARGDGWCRGKLISLNENERAFLEAEEMVHPLLAQPVPNSLRADSEILLTGSNASGKSTFLKTVSLCAILAQSIATVPAKSYKAPYFRILTSMALADNLSGGESYFVVELRSLKRICDAVYAGDCPVLAIVDEVLRGTNTVERIAASSEILASLDRPNALIFAATHDLELTELLAGHYRNMHFEEKIEDGDVRFDYRLREGRSETTNALLLLGASGYDPGVVRAAEDSSRRFQSEGVWEL